MTYTLLACLRVLAFVGGIKWNGMSFLLTLGNILMANHYEPIIQQWHEHLDYGHSRREKADVELCVPGRTGLLLRSLKFPRNSRHLARHVILIGGE